MKTYKPKNEINEGDTIAGVVYAAAAEQVIREGFRHASDADEGHHEYLPFQPTVIGYMVAEAEVDDCPPEFYTAGLTEEEMGDEARVGDVNYVCSDGRTKTEQLHAKKLEKLRARHWSEVDLDRKTELTDKRRLNDVELKELAAINRRLGLDITADLCSKCGGHGEVATCPNRPGVDK